MPRAATRPRLTPAQREVLERIMAHEAPTSPEAPLWLPTGIVDELLTAGLIGVALTLAGRAALGERHD